MIKLKFKTLEEIKKLNPEIKDGEVRFNSESVQIWVIKRFQNKIFSFIREEQGWYRTDDGSLWSKWLFKNTSLDLE